MKKYIFLITIFVCCMLLPSCKDGAGSRANKTVYICNGPNSQKYHKNAECRGLNRCSSEVEEITKGEAEEMGRTPCKICYGE